MSDKKQHKIIANVSKLTRNQIDDLAEATGITMTSQLVAMAIDRMYTQEIRDMHKITIGDYVRVKPHTQYGDLRGGAVHSDMHSHQHNGYKRVQVVSMSTDGSVEVDTGDGMIDVVDISHCSKA